jgi:hypothetical protein
MSRSRGKLPDGQPYIIESDGITVWVNGAVGALARFGRNGIDIHKVGGTQGNECLFCTHAVTQTGDWVTFVDQMQRLYGITVPDKHQPDRFRGKP